MDKKREQKEFLLQTLGRREPKRSNKVERAKKKENTNIYSPEDEAIIKYLGIAFLDAPKQTSKPKEQAN
jgi:hypothetical protein